MLHKNIIEIKFLTQTEFHAVYVCATCNVKLQYWERTTNDGICIHCGAMSKNDICNVIKYSLKEVTERRKIKYMWVFSYYKYQYKHHIDKDDNIVYIKGMDEG